MLISTDGASKEGGLVASCGGVIRDMHWRWLGGLCRLIGAFNAYIDELWGALEGLHLTIFKGYTKMELYLDSQVVVTCLKGTSQGSMEDRNFASHQVVVGLEC